MASISFANVKLNVSSCIGHNHFNYQSTIPVVFSEMLYNYFLESSLTLCAFTRESAVCHMHSTCSLCAKVRT